MVVADDEVDALLLGVFDFLDGLDAAVQHDDELDATLGGIVNALERYAVSLVVAAGYVVLYVGVIILQILVHEGYGRGAVHVIVAVYHDSFLGAHCGVESVHGPVHVGHKERIVQVGDGGSEE